MDAVNKGLPIRRVAVLGAGLMGRGIAAQLAGAGIEVVLLDIVPPGETSADSNARNAFAAGGLKAALKNKPALFYDNNDAALVSVGNFEDDLGKVADVDWVVEAVTENLKIKRDLFEKIDALRKPGALISSNTSGLPLASLIEGRSDDFRKHFIITHFFNPVRYMKLLEVVHGPETEPSLVPRFVSFARRQLGKGVVFAKDSPAFIANRIGIFSILYTVHRMEELGYSPEFVDTVFGKPTGRPKSAVFRTADVVGLDTLAAVAKNLYDALPQDEMRRYLELPSYFQMLIDKGWLGSKTKQGCYKKDRAVGAIVTFDPETQAYRPQDKPTFKSIKAAKGIEDPGRRIKKVVNSKDEAGEFAWNCIAQTLAYSARRLGEVSDDFVQIDNAMRWGFNQELGPFETWDAIGVPESLERMKASGIEVPQWVHDMVASGRTSFYEGPLGERAYWDPSTQSSKPEPVSPRLLRLPASIKSPQLVKKNHGARLWDIGDGALCVEFRTKMNAVDADIVKMLRDGVACAEEGFEALILGNHAADAFSAGANLMLVLMASQQKDWKALGNIVTSFQAANLGMRHSQIPVVAAPFGLTLGGGAEMALGADAIQAHAELYMGLVEVGVGLIPAGGGTIALLHNLMTNAPADADPAVFARNAFLTMGMAKVGVSAEECRKLGFLRPHDRVTMDRDELLEAAKQRALGMARSDYRPPNPRQVKVAGRSGYGTLHSALWGMGEANQVTPHDFTVGKQLARVVTGGDVAAGTIVTEKTFHELECEAFLSLCGEVKTQERMQYMLKNNKPLRN